ncbi:MAG: hypothetical protein IKS19_01895 [Clostridia bacterium]|nr:hypothetical protein [Clostridia bacterium]
MKRIIIAVKAAVAVLLVSCLLAGCSSPVISEKVLNSMMGAYQYAGDMIEQIRTEGLESITSVFKSSNTDEDEEESSSKPKSSSESSSESSEEDSSTPSSQENSKEVSEKTE